MNPNKKCIRPLGINVIANLNTNIAIKRNMNININININISINIAVSFYFQKPTDGTNAMIRPDPMHITSLQRLNILGAQRLNKLMDSKILWLNLCPSSFCWKWWQRGQRNYKGRSEVLSQLISLTM